MADTEITSRPKNQTSQEQKKKQQNFLLILIIVIIAGGIFILYRNGVIGGSASQRPIEKYLQSICDRDFETFVSTMPDAIAQSHRSDKAELGYSDEEYMYELYSDYFEEFGDDMRVEVEFTDKSRPQAIYVDNFRQSYAMLYGEEINISSVFEIDATAHFSGSNSDDYIDLEFYVIKSGGKWYVAGCDYKTEEIGENS